MSFRRVPGQMADKVPEGSGADSRQSSGGFRSRKVMRFRRVPVQMADEVPENSGADSPKLPRSCKLLGVTHEFI